MSGGAAVGEVPVFIENTRENFLFPLTRGSQTRVSDLATTLAAKLQVPAQLLAFRAHGRRVPLDMRLCTVPDTVVIMVHVDDGAYDQINLKTAANQADWSRGTGGTTSARSVITEAALSQVGRDELQHWPRLDLSRNFAGTRANVTLNDTLSTTSSSYNNDGPATGRSVTSLGSGGGGGIMLNSPNRAGRRGGILGGGGSGDANSARSAGGASMLSTSSTVALPKKNPSLRVSLLTVRVGLEGCDDVDVTVDRTSSVADLRIRCNVSADEFPTVSCDGRRVLFEQRTFEEQKIGDNALIVFSTKTDADWDDGTRGGSSSGILLGARSGGGGGVSDAVQSVGRLLRTSGGKNVPLESQLQQRTAASASPNFSAIRASASPSRYQQQQQSGAFGGASPIVPLSADKLGRHGEEVSVYNPPPSPRNYNKAVSPVRSSPRFPTGAAAAAAAATGLDTSSNGGGGGAHSGFPSAASTPAPGYLNITSPPPTLNNINNTSSSNVSGSGNVSPGGRSQQQLVYPAVSPATAGGGGGGGGGGAGSPRARNPKEVLQEQSKARNAAIRAKLRAPSGLVNTPLVAASADAPSRTAWITPSAHPREFQTYEYEVARHGCSLNILFEDPSDEGYTHELRVWSLNPVSHLFPFAGEDAHERFHLLCDGQLVLYDFHSFAQVTKGQQGCLFSFARKA